MDARILRGVNEENTALVFCETSANLIRRIDPQGIITSVGRQRKPYQTDRDLKGPALARSLASITGTAADPAGNIYFTETNSGLVRRFTTAGQIEIFTGEGTGGRVARRVRASCAAKPRRVAAGAPPSLMR